MIITYQFRIKDSSHRAHLEKLASKVNFVQNYLNETSYNAWRRDRKWLSEFDFNKLMTGATKEVGLGSATLEAISKSFSNSRNKAKRSKLSWRSSKRHLGWIPVRSYGIKIVNDCVVFQKRRYRFWKTREIQGKIKTGSFNQNSRGQWFFNLQCEVEDLPKENQVGAVGIDLGLKTIATMSDGSKIENKKFLSKWSKKLAMAQRANKKKQVTAIHNKIKNVRKDFLHKESTKLVKKYETIIVGDVSSSRLAKTRMAKSVLDAGWGMFKFMLEYKAKRLGVNFSVVSEKYSSMTCSRCFERSGPRGIAMLRIREWYCSACGSVHDRDVNAATNILLGLGRQAPLGSPLLGGVKLLETLWCGSIP